MELTVSDCLGGRVGGRSGQSCKGRADLGPVLFLGVWIGQKCHDPGGGRLGEEQFGELREDVGSRDGC